MNRALFLVLIFILTVKINSAFAQVPTITSISPEKGLLGSFVTINGSNFGLTPPENIVYFGAIRGGVISINSNQIIVHSPPATSQPISITVNGLTVYSPRPFMSIIPSPPFSAASIKGRKDIWSQGNHAIAVKDFDDDFKADIAVVGSSGTTLQILKNKSTPGNADFSIDVNKMGSYATGLGVGDLNGDGKPDIVTANYADDKISVFINNSVAGTINFDDAKLYATDRNPYDVAIADFNGDGLPDIAVTIENPFSSSVLVFENATPLNGSLVLKSPKKFGAERYPRGIELGDIDLDGKIDMIVPCQSGALSVFRNTSVLNNIDFEHQVFTLPIGSSPESAVLADFDGDLKLDVAVANNQSNNISVFKGGVNGALLGARQDYATGLANFGISVGDLDSDGNPDIAVTNQIDNSVSLLVNKSSLNNIAFANKIDFPVGLWPRSSALVDVDGDFKHDVIVANNNSSFISILLSNTSKQQAVINFPTPTVPEISPDNILITNATSNNDETPIVYTSSNPNVAYVRSDGKIEVIAPGTTVITANQPETAGFLAASPVSRTYVIKQTQVITFPTLSSKLLCDADFDTGASSNTLQPLFYSSSNTAVATISAAGIIHIVSAGTTTITVTQPGNASYSDAVPKSQVLNITSPLAPTVTITADNNSVCNGSAAVFTATALNAGLNPIYQWMLNGTLQSSNSNKLIVNNIQATDIIQCRVTQSSSCPASALSNSLSVIVQPLLTPGLTIHIPAGYFCSGDVLTFTATAVNEGNQPKYEWFVNNILVETTPTPQFSYSGLNNGDEVSCILTNTSSLCLAAPSVSSNKIVVSIASPPIAQLLISTPSTTVYGATNVQFSVTSSLPVSVYQWQINDINFGGNQPYFITSTLKNGDRVKCIVNINAPCAVPQATNEIVMDVTLPTDIKISNTFTPNSDGINDVWSIPELSFFPNCIVNVFDRNGTLIFSSRGYANAWDGTNNGKKLPSGTYYYVIKTDASKSLQRSGYITIVN